LLRGDSYREVLANQDFRALWLGQALAYLGRSIVHVAVALYVYELTGSARALSFAVALELLPRVLIGPLAGMLADRLERKVVLATAYLVQAGLVALLPLTTTLGQMYVLVFLSSMLSPVADIVRAAALPAVTGQKLFVRGSSLDIVAFNAVNVVGPPLGGWLVSLVGARPTFFVVVGCLLGATAFSSRVHIPGPATEHGLGPRVMWSDLWEGMRFLVRHPLLRYLLLLNCVSSLGWSAPEMVAVVYLTDILRLGGREYGLLRGTISLSMALGVYVLGRYSRALPQRHLLVGGVVLAGLAYMAVLTRPGLALLLGLWFISGIGWAANWLMDNALWARATPDRVRGRVYSLADAAIHLAEVGTTLLGGWLINVLGPIQALCIIGGTVALGAVASSAVAGGYKAVADFDEQGVQNESSQF
jgi:DHA3 family macrolide efflux protein-like MFS transporter